MPIFGHTYLMDGPLVGLNGFYIEVFCYSSRNLTRKSFATQCNISVLCIKVHWTKTASQHCDRILSQNGS